MTFKKLIGIIHLWLGLASGLVVFLLGITGCILAFETEIRGITEPYRKVAVEEKPVLPPSVLKAVADKHLVSKKALGIDYPGQGKAATAMYYDADHFEMLFINPYTAQVLKHKDMKKDFFRVVLDGHFYLWLPPAIGQPIAASATLIFVLMMITGLILWWPKNKAAAKQRFSIKWSARWRRKNYDLHNVLGFYMTWVALFIALTGLVFGFEWFSKSVYWVASGGEKMEEHAHPVSDTTKQAAFTNIADHLWSQHRSAVAATESLGVYFAADETDPVEIVINHRPGTYYNSDYFHYDQYSGVRLKAKGSWDGAFANAKPADKLMRLNYDMHVGAVLGIAGKILAFCASLIAASLPVTGFLIWWGRRNRQLTKAEAVSV
ncbi:MAG TPA: PepSY-associated TM helix domain-containing protein [Ferruginibacter sp.]|nr:PepSY-associated TM helix domain-containing protein [Ferruginibacter sp.]HMP20365.1 PepSY-associated TM helix domain-containing protein [Ferruginibacter sp.]